MCVCVCVRESSYSFFLADCNKLQSLRVCDVACSCGWVEHWWSFGRRSSMAPGGWALAAAIQMLGPSSKPRD